MTSQCTVARKSRTHSAGTRSRFKILIVGRRIGSTKLAAAASGALAVAMLSALLLLISARPTQAQTETVLHSFTGGSDGGLPESSLTFYGGSFYGTTLVGGGSLDLGEGTVFELSQNPQGGWNETVIYDFCPGGEEVCPDGSYPVGPVIFDSAGNLYGTTPEGGAISSDCVFTPGCGTVFEISPAGTTWTEKVLYSFPGGAGGSVAQSDLVMDAAGNLYGTTAYGIGGGSIFELSPSTGGGWTEKLISPGVIIPLTGLTIDASGNIFTITLGATATQATAIEMSPNGAGGWTSTVIYTYPDNIATWGTLVFDQAGNLYGAKVTSCQAGYRQACNLETVYKLTPGKGEWTRTILFTSPQVDSVVETSAFNAGLTLDAAGNIYGTTILTGTYSLGTVFELVAPVGGGSYEEKILWNFDGSDGSQPLGAPTLDNAGDLYGTTYQGGTAGNGAVFEVNPSGAATTTTAFTSSLNPSIYGQSVTWTAIVTTSGSAPPTGKVNFSWDGESIGTPTLNSSGVATLTKSNLSADPYPLIAAYLGDANNAKSTSAVLNQVVTETTSSTALTSLPNPSTEGQSVTFTVTVSSPTVIPTGPVTFTAGKTTLGTVELRNGKAEFTISTLAVGTTTVTATFYGDSNITSSSASVMQTVQQ
jgi:uncharacterized repeat protein (TIGR03803 family)